MGVDLGLYASPFQVHNATVVKLIAKGIVRLLPFKHQIVQLGALLPFQLKNRFTVRLFQSLLRSLDSQPELQTNLGIDSHLRVSLKSLGASPTYLFGKPSIYYGERGALLLAKRFAELCDWFVDIGANCGYYSYFVHFNSPKTKVFAFEPNWEFYTLMRSMVEQNHLDNISVCPLGISDKKGRSDFYLDRSDGSMGSLLSNFGDMHHLEKCSIEVTDFDSFALENNIFENAVIKVDIENAEHLFIDGARQSLKSIRYLIIELLHPARQSRILERLISEFGFYAYYINDFALEQMEYEDNRYSPGEFNWLFCRESRDELALILAGTPFRIISAPGAQGIDFQWQPFSRDTRVKV